MKEIFMAILAFIKGFTIGLWENPILIGLILAVIILAITINKIKEYIRNK